MAARRWQTALATAGAVFVGAVLLVAAWAKALDPEAFAEQIVSEGLAPAGGWAVAVAFVALALEIGLGTALVLGIRRLWVLVPAAALSVFFLFLTGRSWWRASHGLLDPAAACGCFGNLVERTPAEAFWQDLLLLVPGLAVAFAWRTGGSGQPWRRLAAATIVTAAGLLLAWRAPELPLDDLATRLHPGVEVAELCAGAGDERICLDAVAEELEQGSHLVVLADLESEPFLTAVPALNERALSGAGLPLMVVTASPPEAVGAFGWTHAPAFPVREAPAALVRPLYRRLPRSFRVEDGTVTATWPGLPPELAAQG